MDRLSYIDTWPYRGQRAKPPYHDQGKNGDPSRGFHSEIANKPLDNFQLQVDLPGEKEAEQAGEEGGRYGENPLLELRQLGRSEEEDAEEKDKQQGAEHPGCQPLVLVWSREGFGLLCRIGGRGTGTQITRLERWSGRAGRGRYRSERALGCALRGPHATRTVGGRSNRSVGERGDGSRRGNFHRELAPRAPDGGSGLAGGSLKDHLALRTGEADHGN